MHYEDFKNLLTLKRVTFMFQCILVKEPGLLDDCKNYNISKHPIYM